MRIHQINKFCNQIQLIEIGLECVVERIEEEKTIKIQQCEIGLNVGRKESEKSKNTTMWNWLECWGAQVAPGLTQHLQEGVEAKDDDNDDNDDEDYDNDDEDNDDDNYDSGTDDDEIDPKICQCSEIWKN